MRRNLRRLAITLGTVGLVYFLPLGLAVTSHYAEGGQGSDWRTARRDSAGIAPPAETHESVIHVYAARAFRWRGAFGVHSWIAAKPSGTDTWTRFEVMGFNVMRGGEAVRVGAGVPDAYWYGAMPTLLREVRGGAEVDAIIERLHTASREYPHNHEYRVWPGPNSNTYIAHLGRAVPELSIDLPPTAIGKDYLPAGGLVARAPSGGGMQFSLAGLLGVIVAPEEGLELNVLGLSAGVDVWPPALKLPGLGRIGWPSHPVPGDGEAWAQD